MSKRDLQILLGLVEFEIEWWEGGHGEFTFEELEDLRARLNGLLESGDYDE